MDDIDFATVGNKKVVHLRSPRVKKSVTPPIGNLNLASAHQLIEQDFDEAIAGLEVKQSTIKVKDGKSSELIVMVGNKAKNLRQAMDVRRKEIIGDAKEFVDGVNGKVKKFTVRLQAVEASAKRKSGEYQYYLDLERDKQQEEIRKANVALQEKLDAEAEKSGVEAPKVEPMPMPKQDKVVRTEDGSSSHIRKKWKPTIVDPDKVDRKYCEPSLKKLQQAVDMGARELAGCEVKEEISTVFRGS